MLFSLTIPLLLQAFSQKVLEVERLIDGTTLVVDGGPKDGMGGVVFRVDGKSNLLHAWQTPGAYTHAAKLLPESRVLVADTQADRMVILDNDGSIVWSSDVILPLSDGSDFDYLNDIDLLPNGNVLVSDCFHHRVLEVDFLGNVLWQFGETGVAGGSATRLRYPHNPQVLANGNIMIADYGNNRIVEVDASGSMVWAYGPTQGKGKLDKPRDACVTLSGEVAIADSHNQRILVVARDGTFLQELKHSSFVYDVDALANGNFLVGGGTAVEYDNQGNTVWAWPPGVDSVSRSLSVIHPISGSSIPVTLHTPRSSPLAEPVPCVILVPGSETTNTTLDVSASRWAQVGWAGVWFDLAGTSGVSNDLGGYVDQVGFHAVLQFLANRPEIDQTRLAVIAQEYGMTLASGALARWPNQPQIALLVDWEGCANRWESSYEYGGPIPRVVANQKFWAEREATVYLPLLSSAYLRIESQAYRNRFPPPPPQSDPLAGLRAALRSEFGGMGLSPNVIYQGELDHPMDLLPSGSSPLLSDSLADFPYIGFRLHREIQRVFERPSMRLQTAPSQARITADLSAGIGMARAEYFIACSKQTASIQLKSKSWISLELDALLFSSLKTGLLDATGSTSVDWLVPSSWTGLQIFAQAVVVKPGAFLDTWVSPTQSLILR